jgi:hypothetical protein
MPGLQQPVHDFRRFAREGGRRGVGQGRQFHPGAGFQAPGVRFVGEGAHGPVSLEAKLVERSQFPPIPADFREVAPHELFAPPVRQAVRKQGKQPLKTVAVRGHRTVFGQGQDEGGKFEALLPPFGVVLEKHSPFRVEEPSDDEVLPVSDVSNQRVHEDAFLFLLRGARLRSASWRDSRDS